MRLQQALLPCSLRDFRASVVNPLTPELLTTEARKSRKQARKRQRWWGTRNREVERQQPHGFDDGCSPNQSYDPSLQERLVGLIQHRTSPISEKVIGAAIEVHRYLGPGLLESSYHTCLCRELELRTIAYHSQVALPIEYKGIQIARGYVVDLLIEDSVVVEIKSVDKLLPIHSAQLMTYMRLQGVSSGLLMNFNVALLPQGIRRILL